MAQCRVLFNPPPPPTFCIPTPLDIFWNKRCTWDTTDTTDTIDTSDTDTRDTYVHPSDTTGIYIKYYIMYNDVILYPEAPNKHHSHSCGQPVHKGMGYAFIRILSQSQVKSAQSTVKALKISEVNGQAAQKRGQSFHRSRGGHSHMRNTKSCDQGHKLWPPKFSCDLVTSPQNRWWPRDRTVKLFVTLWPLNCTVPYCSAESKAVRWRIKAAQKRPWSYSGKETVRRGVFSNSVLRSGNFYG